MTDVVNFTWLGVGYCCIPIDILELYSVLLRSSEKGPQKTLLGLPFEICWVEQSRAQSRIN